MTINNPYNCKDLVEISDIKNIDKPIVLGIRDIIIILIPVTQIRDIFTYYYCLSNS